MQTILIKIKAVPNRGSLLFGRIRIIKIVIRPNADRIRIVALNVKTMSLSFITVNDNIVILDNSFTFNVINLF